jgi:biopolymer transport protein ExbD
MSRSRLLRSSSAPIEEPTINLTPLIDVVFVILIMFILIAPLLELQKIELADGPQTINDTLTSVQESSLIAIHVHADNSVWLNQEPVSFQQLPEKLKEIHQRLPQVIPQVYHDRRAHFGTYQIVKNAAETAGFNQIEIILKPA